MRDIQLTTISNIHKLASNLVNVARLWAILEKQRNDSVKQEPQVDSCKSNKYRANMAVSALRQTNSTKRKIHGFFVQHYISIGPFNGVITVGEKRAAENANCPQKQRFQMEQQTTIKDL